VGDKEVDNFEPELYISNEEVVLECEKILQNNFLIIQVNYLENLFRSKKYPEIDFDNFSNNLLNLQSRLLKKKIIFPQKINRLQIEQCFKHGTKNDKTSGLGGALCRGEYMDAILRLAHTWASGIERERLEKLGRKLDP